MRLPKRVIREIEKQAEAEYPSECCGLILGKGKLEVRPCKNVYDKYHGIDPEAYPRTSRTAYLIDPLVQLQIFDEARAGGRDVLAIYHSHVNAGAYFSEEDQRVAAAFGGEPTFPGVGYFVISVVEGKAVDRNLFIWSSGERKYVTSTPNGMR